MARDTFGLANERAQQRAEQGTPIQAGEGTDAAANYVESHGMTNSAPDGVAKHISHPPPFKPDSWIPIEEHVLGKPRRKVKIISIGCGFSGV
jgi:hypothetical protein